MDRLSEDDMEVFAIINKSMESKAPKTPNVSPYKKSVYKYIGIKGNVHIR